MTVGGGTEGISWRRTAVTIGPCSIRIAIWSLIRTIGWRPTRETWRWRPAWKPRRRHSEARVSRWGTEWVTRRWTPTRRRATWRQKVRRPTGGSTRITWWWHVWVGSTWEEVLAVDAALLPPVLSKIDADLRVIEPLARETHCSVHGIRTFKFDMAKKCATPLAPIQADLLDVTTPLEERMDHVFGDVHWKPADPNRAAIVWFLVLWCRCPLLSDPVRCKRLVLGEIEANRHALDGRASKLHSSVHRFSV